ncbi:uncharacterized protein [Clytia hemisphaerica]|uniref:uncharacterized protein n=1 Tax=Clytia hemisphaerica TaxID=252671 RepID=UPI0034D61B1B
MLLFAYKSTGKIVDIQLTSSFLVRVMLIQDSQLNITNIKIDDVIIQKAIISDDYFKFIQSEVRIDNLQITNSKMSTKHNALFKISSPSKKLVINKLSINDTEFREMFVAHKSTTLTLSDIQIHRVSCFDIFVYSFTNTVSVKHLKIVNSTWVSSSSDKPSIFWFAEARVIFEEVQFINVNTNAEALIESRAGLLLEIKNISIIDTHAPETIILLNSKGKVAINGVRIKDSILDYAFHTTGSVDIFDVYTFNMTLRQTFLVSNDDQAIISRLLIQNSLIANFVQLEGNEKSVAKLVVTNLRVENTSIINHCFEIKFGNAIIQNLSMANDKIGNLVDASKSVLKLEKTTLDETKVMNVMFLGQASPNVFTFTGSCQVTITKFQMVRSTADENILFVDNSVLTLEDTQLENNSYATAFKVLYSKINLSDFQSVGNRVFGQIKFINAKATSTLHLKNILVKLNELLEFERAMDIIDTELYMDNFHTKVETSLSLKFDIMNWEFQNQMSSNLTNLTIQCPKNFNVMLNKQTRTKKSLSLSCERCDKKTYPVISAGREFNITTKIDKSKSVILENLQNTMLQCQNCPTGASCEHGAIKARDNFYGFMNTKNEFEFILCPGDYCCNKDSSTCVSPTTCNFKRTGPFCGQCILMIICKKISKTETQKAYQKADGRLVEIFELPYKEKYFWWEAWRLMERFIVAGLSVFLTNPIYRILYITSAFALFSYLHRRVNPYKRTMFLLKRLDAVSWICLLLISLLNEMRAVAYIYNIPNVDSINHALKAADILEKVFSPLWHKNPL